MKRAGLSALGAAWLLSAPGCFPELPASTPLAADRGVDARVPDMAADSEPDAVEPDEGTPPDMAASAERCNGLDDDLDGTVDEGFPLDMPCVSGQGLCAADGVTVCADDGLGVWCNAEPGSPTLELCNGLDDDCSGVIDEGFEGLNEPCVVGDGVCFAEGVRVCTEDGSAVVCGVQPVEANRALEACNGLDDDCDGVTDEGLVQGCEADAVGICRAGRRMCEGGAWSACEGDVQPGERSPDLCDGVDDDCDGTPDEDVLPDRDQPCAAPCDVGIEGCVPVTDCVEQCDPGSPVLTRCARAPEIRCDGADDDCDGVIDDDGVCGAAIAETCSLTFGWSNQAIESPAAAWGGCDPEVGGISDTYSCNVTRGSAFATIELPAGADLDSADDRIGVSLRCGEGEVGDFITRTCRVVVGVALPEAGAADGSATFGPCPDERVGGDPTIACTSTSGTPDFLPLPLPFDLTADSLLGVAFVCDDPEDPQRADALQRSLAVSVAWADSRAALLDDRQWQAACAPLGDGNPYTACATTQGDGRFRLFRITADVDGADRFAIRLAPIEP